MMRVTIVRKQGGQLTTTTPWDTVAPRLQGFADKSKFVF
jgi:protein-L-isoaspartate(D-aspartate) O-methyltransferase